MFAEEPATNYGNFVNMHVHVDFFVAVVFAFLFSILVEMHVCFYFVSQKPFTNTDAYIKRTHESKDAQNKDVNCEISSMHIVKIRSYFIYMYFIFNARKAPQVLVYYDE